MHNRFYHFCILVVFLTIFFELVSAQDLITLNPTTESCYSISKSSDSLILKVSDIECPIGQAISPNLDNDAVVASNVIVSINNSGAVIDFYKDNSKLYLYNSGQYQVFDKIKKSSEIRTSKVTLNFEGNIIGADFITDNSNEYSFYKNKIKSPKDTKIYYSLENEGDFIHHINISLPYGIKLNDDFLVIDGQQDNNEIYDVKIIGEEIKLSNGMILNNGFLTYLYQGRYSVSVGDFARVNGLKINALSESVFLFDPTKDSLFEDLKNFSEINSIFLEDDYKSFIINITEGIELSFSPVISVNLGGKLPIDLSRANDDNRWYYLGDKDDKDYKDVTKINTKFISEKLYEPSNEWSSDEIKQYDERTLIMAKKYQKKHFLEIDGFVGVDTLSSILGFPDINLKASKSKIYFGKGDVGEYVIELKKLFGLDYNKSNEFDDELYNQIINYQKRNKLLADGRVGDETIYQMRKDFIKGILFYDVYLIKNIDYLQSSISGSDEGPIFSIDSGILIFKSDDKEYSFNATNPLEIRREIFKQDNFIFFIKIFVGYIDIFSDKIDELYLKDYKGRVSLLLDSLGNYANNFFNFFKKGNLEKFTRNLFNQGNNLDQLNTFDENDLSSLDERIKYSCYYFQINGYSAEQAAGIIGNLIVESPGLDSTAYGDYGKSYGIAQWKGDRLVNLRSFESVAGLSYSDFKTQLEFILDELDSSYFSNAKKDLLRQETVEGATVSFMNKFEKPGIPHQNRRVSEALKAYEICKTGAVPIKEVRYPKDLDATKKICLDAGHGDGYNPFDTNVCTERNIDISFCNEGINNRLTVEKIEKKFEELCFTQGTCYDFYLTRSGTTDVGLMTRTELANDQKCDIFISIHSNSGKLSGTLTLIADGAFNNKNSNALRLANIIQPKVASAFGSSDLGVRSDIESRTKSLAVLRYTDMPAILIEIGYYDNPTDVVKILDDNYRSVVADAVVSGVEEYFKV
ncbi:MAG TPA: phage tail tip lysozyme [Candidatus Paceibacterota bacterium]|nr:phage tail tip lysozyme [Candidatus Paceibacterota bacterium]